jgi:hypothetical protein
MIHVEFYVKNNMSLFKTIENEKTEHYVKFIILWKK